MGKTSFQNINSIIDHLKENITKLNEGKLSVEEVEILVDQSKELYERLVILRYKAYENFNLEKDVLAQEESDKAETIFDFTKPETEKINKPEISHDLESDQKGFDFTIDEEQTFETKAESKIDEVQEGESLNEKFSKEELPLHEALKDDDNKSSLRKDLQNKPIEDIKKEISIARRFEYISLLFDGKGDVYDDAINTLNNCENAEDARSKLSEYSKNFNWDLENKTIVKFVELVERRYM